MRFRPSALSENEGKEKFVDVVTLSGKSDMRDEAVAKIAYTREDIIRPKKS